MREKDNLNLTDLDQRRWVRYQLPIMVCVDLDEAGDQHVRYVVPVLDEIEMAADHQDEPIVYRPDGIERVPDRRADDAAWQAISHAGHSKDTWIGETPFHDWDWLEDPEDLTANDRYTQQETDDEDDDPRDE